MKRASLPIALLLTLGCSGHATSPMGAAPDLAGPGSGIMTQGDQICMQVSLPPLQPGDEATSCLVGHLPNADPVDIVKIDVQQESTHHVIFYKQEIDMPDQPVADCPPLDLLQGGRVVKLPLFIGETPQAELTMPPGVAYTLPAHAGYSLEVHHINPGTQPIAASAKVCLTKAAAGTKTIPADMLFYASIKALNKSYDGKMPGIPPGQTVTLDPPGFHAPKPGAQVFALTTHQHRMGVEFDAYKATGASDPGHLLLKNTDWQHPALLRLPDDHLLTFDPATGEGLRWTCTYDNKNDFYLTFGQSAFKNEMCILWGYYYPSQGFDIYFE